MAEQLILKGTLEGHVSRPCCRQFQATREIEERIDNQLSQACRSRER